MAWEKGISTHEFRKCYTKDLQEVMKIRNALGEKAKRAQKVRDLMNKVRF